MFTDSERTRLVVGLKQTKKAIKEGAERVVLAHDASEIIKAEIKELFANVEYVDTMQELGKLCGIDVKAAVSAVKK